MANLKLFVSSTCYDLNIVRGQLRAFINSMGYEPVMSDYNDVLFDPRNHTHDSCVKEIQNADMVILIIGSRFGGKALPKSVQQVDIESLKKASKSNTFLDKGNFSITQLEILKAVEMEIPIFTFIDSRVSHDHLFYEKNKMKKGFMKDVDFPSIDKKETAVFIFEFINFIRHRSKNNSIAEFTKFEDIQDYLRRQWASLFQRMLFEQKSKKEEIRRFDFLNSQLTDIKTTLLTTITNADLKETARGAIKYRQLIDFVTVISLEQDETELLLKSKDLDEILKKCEIAEVVSSDGVSRSNRYVYYVKNDRTFFISRLRFNLDKLSEEFSEFKDLIEDSKKAIINAIKEIEDRRFMFFRYRPFNFDEYLAESNDNNSDDIVTE
ncbi:DUF4062 domain-containing protein [Corallibacter sp.]|uniref:DUF4062 domain-containing protein n=1 Tax=Corallibacter sp. TaxID=2038084 RepID=UPI003A8CFE22